MLLNDFGLKMEVPDAWYGDIFEVTEPITSGPIIHVSTHPLVSGDGGFADRTRTQLEPEGAVIALVKNVPEGQSLLPLSVQQKVLYPSVHDEVPQLAGATVQ